MEEQLIEAVNKAIGQLVLDFQGDPTRYWNERDIHWNLFHCLKQQGIFQQGYVTELIRAEFPTRKKYREEDGKPARGHYDLVVLAPEPFATKALQEMPSWAPWDKYLPLVQIMAAVEVKMWVDRWSDTQRDERVGWDILKLTDPGNAVEHAYLLNFVQLDFSRPQMKDYYHKLRKHLIEQAKHQLKLKILCVPSDCGIQLPSDNWISAPK